MHWNDFLRLLLDIFLYSFWAPQQTGSILRTGLLNYLHNPHHSARPRQVAGTKKAQSVVMEWMVNIWVIFRNRLCQPMVSKSRYESRHVLSELGLLQLCIIILKVVKAVKVKEVKHEKSVTWRQGELLQEIHCSSSKPRWGWWTDLRSLGILL